jgi:hypothetical protein
MSDASYLSWEEVQRLMLPPNATMLIPPPPPDPAEVSVVGAGGPPKPDWLDDAYSAGVIPPKNDLRITPEEAQSAAAKAEYGPAVTRLLANVIAVNAVLNLGQSPPKLEEDEEEQRRRKEAT